jgi:hypothetical protein
MLATQLTPMSSHLAPVISDGAQSAPGWMGWVSAHAAIHTGPCTLGYLTVSAACLPACPCSDVSVSPDGRYLLVSWLEPPWSNTLQCGR